LVMHVVLW